MHRTRGAALRLQRCPRAFPLCMATPLRVARVSKQLNREISQLFVTDKVIQKAMKGIRAGFELDEIATVTDVVVSGDLQVAKVYISLYDTHGGDPSEATWERLCKLQPYVRKMIGQRLSLKRTPEVRFIQDRDFENMYKALALLEWQKEAEASGEEPMEQKRASQYMKTGKFERTNKSEVPDSGSAFSDMF